jgi:hypothetical protein
MVDISGFLSRLALRLNRRARLWLPVTENGEIRAIHAAQIAAGAFVSVYKMRWVVAFGVERRGELQDVGGAEFHTEATSLTSFGDDNNGASIQGAPLLPYSRLHAI